LKKGVSLNFKIKALIMSAFTDFAK